MNPAQPTPSSLFEEINDAAAQMIGGGLKLLGKGKSNVVLSGEELSLNELIQPFETPAADNNDGFFPADKDPSNVDPLNLIVNFGVGGNGSGEAPEGIKLNAS